jgi:hypothetical protein
MKIQELCSAILKDPIHFNFQEALINHAKSEDYAPYQDTKEWEEEFNRSLKKKDEQSLMKAGYGLLDQNAFDIESHILISQAAFRLGQKPLFHLHNFIASSLLDFILKSGDGKAFLSAYKVLYPKDEIAIFTFLKKYPKDRTTHEKNDKVYDIYTFENGENLFFDITLPFMHSVRHEEKSVNKRKREL